jgi:CRISPR-associated protein Csb2
VSRAVPRGLLLSVRFHDGRYHGVGDWPPSPARLFQALVAGAACGHDLADHDKAALAWLESLPAPIIAAPIVRLARGFTNFVPNNDLDAVGGDPLRVGKIRAGKTIRPALFDSVAPLLYAWTFRDDDADAALATAVCAIAERLYQLGRGVDMAWACGEILDAGEVEARLAAYEGAIHRPGGTVGRSLPCPMHGSLDSLAARFHDARNRFSRGAGKQQLFTQPRKARFAMVSYDSPPRRELFDLREPGADASFAPWAVTRAVALVEKVRDDAAARLQMALPDKAATIDRVFVGRGATEADKATRIRIMPLPSIGHTYADHAIRRVLVELPPNCPLPAADIAWAFSGLDLGVDYHTGEVLVPDAPILTPAADDTMLTHFGYGEGYRLWRTVTSAALPEAAKRRRIEPSRIRDRAEQKGAEERIKEETQAASAVRAGLRHAGIDAPVESIRVQREPFEAKGARAEAFAEGTRFVKERLWHVEIAFTEPVRGPLVLGDGRYLGLGLLAPVRQPRSIFAFALMGAKTLPGHEAAIAFAARRAVMARVQDKLGQGKPLPAFFTGHESTGAPNRPGNHAHLFYAVDFSHKPARLLIVAPHRVEHRLATKWDRECLHDLGEALAGFTILRAGEAGRFELTPLGELPDDDPVCGLSRTWISAAPYRPTRHAKRGTSIEDALVADMVAECARRNLPQPHVELLSYDTGPRGGVLARLHLTFAVSVEGPILLGHDAHRGGGVFAAHRSSQRDPQ